RSETWSVVVRVLWSEVGCCLRVGECVYLPVLHRSFARREATISLLDARAGSPPTAFELLRRHAGAGIHGLDALTDLLHDWERWSAELMESHLSYPVLAYFRSQHDNQSCIGSLTVILDVCAL